MKKKKKKEKAKTVIIEHLNLKYTILIGKTDEFLLNYQIYKTDTNCMTSIQNYSEYKNTHIY